MPSADEDRRSAMRSPSLPNRTGGSPASGFPVSGCSSEEEHAFRAVPKDARQTFGSTQANCTRLVPPPVSPRGHSRWFVFRHSVLHPSTFLRSLRSTVVARFARVFGDSAGWPIAVPQASPFPRRLAPTRRPNRVHGVLLPRRTFVTDWSFSFHCSPPRVAATQLRFDTIRFSTAWERTSTAPTQRLLRRTRARSPSAPRPTPKGHQGRVRAPAK